MLVDRFEHDPEKSKINEQRHGVSLSEAQELWNAAHVIIPAKNVSGENRHAVVGKIRGKIYVAIFAKRGEAVRIISCHRADKRWGRVYEEYIRQES